MSRLKEYIALFNAGASYIMMGIWFIIMALYIVSYNTLSKAIAAYSKIASTSLDKSLDDLGGRLALAIFFFIVSLAAVVFGMMYVREYIKGTRSKSVSGLISTVACAVLWGYAAVKTITSMSASKNASSSSDILESLSSIFSADWISWVILLFELFAVVMTIAGFISTFITPSQKILTAEEQDDINKPNIGNSASVVEQFAKPVKKELPPMLNGDQDDSSATTANPSNAGLRTISPIRQAEPTTPNEPVANNTDGSQNTTTYGAGQ